MAGKQTFFTAYMKQLEHPFAARLPKASKAAQKCNGEQDVYSCAGIMAFVRCPACKCQAKENHNFAKHPSPGCRARCGTRQCGSTRFFWTKKKNTLSGSNRSAEPSSQKGQSVSLNSWELVALMRCSGFPQLKPNRKKQANSSHLTHMAVAQKNVAQWYLGEWNQRLKLAEP